MQLLLLLLLLLSQRTGSVWWTSSAATAITVLTPSLFATATKTVKTLRTSSHVRHGFQTVVTAQPTSSSATTRFVRRFDVINLSCSHNDAASKVLIREVKQLGMTLVPSYINTDYSQIISYSVIRQQTRFINLKSQFIL